MDAPQKLDPTAKQNVGYCIPGWLRDEQVKLNLQSVPDRIQPADARPEPIAIVGYGPSLNETWEKIRDFKYVMSCSGSHRFLLDRGIVPTWHVEVDPRQHKIALLGAPHQDVEYLVCSACHPDYVQHLNGFRRRLWHVFSNEEEAYRLIPRNDWAIMGGCDVGTRCLTLAGFMGFRNMHVFGLDGSTPTPDGLRHAAAHPNSFKIHSTVDHNGRTFYTTPGMLEAARGLWHELDMMPKVTAQFYGDGLIQEMAKTYVQKPDKNALIAVSEYELISPEYRELNRRLHHDNLAYGVGGGRLAPTVLNLLKTIGSQSVLDYGCGKGYLQKALPFPIWEYDPAVHGKDHAPRPADLVVCGDVLEHIEPDKLLFVLDDLRRCTKKVGYFIIHTGKSSKTLADGRNAHLIQEGRDWWEKRLRKFFQVGQIQVQGPLLHVVVVPKPVKLKPALNQKAMA